MDRIIELRKALAPLIAAELSNALGESITVEQRYAPYFEPEDLATPRWLLLVNAEEVSRQARGLAPAELTIDLGLQAAIDRTETAAADFFDADRIDVYTDQMGVAKSLFRPGGPLRDARVAECEFRRYTHAPIYRPDLLSANGLFISVLSLIYYHEFDE